MEILQTVKALLGTSGDDRDEVLKLYISIVTQRAVNYCNIWELPEELSYTVAQMVVDMVNEATLKESAASGGWVTSISEGGRTVGMASPGVIADISTKADERIPKRSELNKFKQLYKLPKPVVEDEDGI